MRLVLDTNVVLDWLVFDDPLMDPVREAVRDGSVEVLSHPFAEAELYRVLAYPALRLSAARREEVHDRYVRATSRSHSVPEHDLRSSLPNGFPRCRDGDDDAFLALAYLTAADALVSRDKAVLSLKRRAMKFDLSILNVQEMIAALETRKAWPG